MKYSPIDLNLRGKLDAGGKPYPLEFGSVAGDMVLRKAATGDVLVANVAGLVEKDDGSSYQHVFTCHRGGAVVIPFNPRNKKVGLTFMHRPVVRPDMVDAYQSAWDQCIERNDPAYANFKQALFPMLGMETYQFPQGYGEAGDEFHANALRVLKVQVGFDSAIHLEQLEGYVAIDPGNRVSPVSFYIAHVDPAARRADPALPAIIWLDEREYLRDCNRKWIISDFTRSGYSLLKENEIW